MKIKLQELIDLMDDEVEESIGDGKAVFMENGTDDDFEEFDRKENKGWSGFYKKVKNLGK